MDELNPTLVLRLAKVRKTFGAHVAVESISLDVQQGEFFTLLGPSGCGKTTTLRLIAGLEQPDDGEIRLGERVLVDPSKRIFVQPEKRQMGMVFQSYAIWPHLTVAENIAYPLKLRKMKKDEVKTRVENALDLVGMPGLGQRSASALSGGQQQRVAVARALVYEPGLLLLDEPFSNLDAKLREQMCLELKILQRRLGVAVILVTHDQIEALSMSDRIAVLKDGNIEQVASPTELYHHPATPFVRDFVGASITASATVRQIQGKDIAVAVDDWGEQLFWTPNCFVPDPREGMKICLAIRPERVAATPYIDEAPSTNSILGIIETILFVGDRLKAQIRVGASRLVCYLRNDQPWMEKNQVQLHFYPDAVSLWAS